MANIFDYLNWRGDLSFRADKVNTVDALIFAALSYLKLPEHMQELTSPVSIQEMAAAFFDQDSIEDKCICSQDCRLIEEAMKTNRFGTAQLISYQDVLQEETDTQFSAETWRIDDGTMVIAFRGTDNTLVGWKENFNMSYQPVVAAQTLALTYTRQILETFPGNVVLTGHSKGGNLAVFAGAGVGEKYADRIRRIYNMDGPGFASSFLNNPGYLRACDRIISIVPQSSVVGMLLEHKEPTYIVYSNQVGILQHDLYSWQVIGKRFETRQELTADAKLVNQAIMRWVYSMEESERSRVVDEIFDLARAGGVMSTKELLQPKTIRRYLQTLGSDEVKRKAVASDFQKLLQAAKEAAKEARENKE